MIANPALTMERECRSILSERATLDPFEALAGETPALPHDPLNGSPFSLANAPIVRRLPEDGIAANWVRIC